MECVQCERPTDCGLVDVWDCINNRCEAKREDTIVLQAPRYNLRGEDNQIFEEAGGPNGLPSITSPIRITIPVGEPRAIIRRDSEGRPFRIFHVASTGRLGLDGVSIENGLIETGSVLGGGGIRNLGTLTLNNSSVRSNTVCSLVGGEVSGGGIENFSRVELDNSDVSKNKVGVGGSCGFGFGGGISSNGPSAFVTLTGSTVSENIASINGGGIENFGGTLELRNSTVDSNVAGFGGGILNDPRGGLGGNTAIARLSRSTVSRNESRFFGGAATGGGGITNFPEATLGLRNSTVSSNIGGPAGGFDNGGTLTLNNVTITANSATPGGVSGIRNEGRATISNTIIAENANNTDCAGEFISRGFNLIGNIQGIPSLACTGFGVPGDLIGFDANLGPLARLPTEETETHLFPFTSPATEAGNPDPVRTPNEESIGARGDACEGVDQRGFMRPRDGNRDSMPICDIGAVEIGPP